jgi:FkbM family methyltransferase
VWDSVQSGLSRGMWMQLFLPRESRYWRGIHEPEVQDAISSTIRFGDVLYDVGAHLGSISLGTARLVGESGRVVAFDGDPENVERLRKNTARNRMEKRLQVEHVAIWSSTARQEIGFRRGRITRSEGGVESDGIRPVIGDGEITTVPTITLDGFVAAGGPLPHLIKIDVEGGEYEVLRGGTELFRNHRPLLIVEVHHQRAAEQISAWIESCKYVAHWKIEDYPRRLFAWPMEYDGAAWMRESTALENQRVNNSKH